MINDQFSMKRQISIIFILFLPIILALTRPSLVRGAEEFSTAYFVTYDFTNKDGTLVDFRIRITNLTNRAYINEYTLNLATGAPEEVKAYDLSGPLELILNKTNTGTQVKTNFKDKIVGKDAFRDWHITYIDHRVGQKNGLIWNITIPKFSQEQNVSAYTVRLDIPEDFGPEIFSSPNAAKIEKESGKKIYYFEGEELKNSGALLNFGRFQLFKFNLKYHLKNPNLLPSNVNITLPPSIRGEQEIYIKNIDPAPANIQVDNDGNYLAAYRLTDKREKIVTVEGYARVTHPKRDLDASGKMTEIPKPLAKVYTTSQPYWETDDEQIKDIVEKVVKSGQSVSQTARALFNYTTATLKYNKGRINSDLTRYGAKKALQNKEDAVCMEFADLLTTLLRAAGIPAQVLEGYAFTEDETVRPVVGDVLHSWVRYYDPRIGWVSVDPTWTSTSGLDYFGRLDTNHLVFAIKGSSSIHPFPAGAYKISPTQTGDINVILEKEDVDFPKEKIEMGVDLSSSSFFSFLSPKIKLILTNKGGVSAFDGVLKVASDQALPETSEVKVGPLPPFSQREIPLSLKTSLWKTSADLSLRTVLSYTNFDGEFKEVEWGQSVKLPTNIAGPIALGILVALFPLAYWFLLNHSSGRKK